MPQENLCLESENHWRIVNLVTGSRFISMIVQTKGRVCNGIFTVV